MMVVETKKAPAAIGPYVQAIVANGMVYTSGQIPLTASGELVTGDVAIQTHQVFENLKAILEEANADLETVVKATVFLKSMNDFQQVNEVYSMYFSKHQPARSCIEVARLPKDVLVEIECVAMVK